MLKNIKQFVIVAIGMMFSPILFAADTPEPLFANGLGWKPGPVCTYKANHSGKKAEWTFEVTGVDGNQTTGVWKQLSPDPGISVPVIKIENGLRFTADIAFAHGTAITSEPGYQWLVFPLQPKAEWNTEVVMDGTNGANNKPYKVKVAASFEAKKWEKIKIAAGETMALRVDVNERYVGLDANYKGSGSYKMWLGHGNCSLKKIDYSNSFKEKGALELIAERAP